MPANHISFIMPDITEEHAIETTKIHSIAGTLDTKKNSNNPSLPRPAS